MAFKKRRFASRSRRARTRWYAINPDGRTITTTNSWVSNTLAPQVAVNEIPFGSTLLRVILDVEMSPSIVTAGGLEESGHFTAQVGLFVAPTTAPSSIDWDPNFPHGNWIARDNESYWIRRFADGNVIHTSHRRIIRFDTAVKRKLQENSQLHMAIRHFEGGIVDNVAYGWSGRYLVALP